MAECSANDLLAENPCFAGLLPYYQQAASLALWCSISENITPVTPVVPPGGLWNPEEPGPINNPDAGVITNPEA